MKQKKFNLGMVWSVGLVIYFVFFGFIINSSRELGSSVNEVEAEYFGTSFSDFNEGCSFPKTYIKEDGTSEVTNSRRHLSGVSCEFTKGRYNETACNDIEGCAWHDSIWPISDYCDGDVNRTYYGITTDNIDNDPDVFFAIDAGFVAVTTLGEHINAFTDEVYESLYYDAYRLTAIRYNETLCDMYGFNWLPSSALYDQEREESNIWRTFTKYTGWSYDWDSGNKFVDNMLTFLTVILPGLMLVAALFILITPTK